MNCWRTRQLIAAFLDGELSPAETELIDDHLRSCPECSELRDRIADIPPLDLPRLDPDAEADIWARMDDALDAAWERQERGLERGVAAGALAGIRSWLRGRRVAIPLPVAAAYLLIIVGLTGLNLLSFQRVHRLSAEVDAHNQVVDGRGSETAPVIRAAGTVQPARSPYGATATHALTASVGMRSLERAADHDDEEPPPLSIPVYDTATGAVIFHAVDQAPAIGY
jgi:anti-sigma factor RsiW